MVTRNEMATERYRRRPETVTTGRGSGAPIVLAHGTLMDRSMFAPQVAALSDEYRVVAYDLRARTDQFYEPYDLYDLADDAVALLDGLAIDTCVLGGMSMGGFMALRFATEYPDRLDGLVLIDSMAEAHTADEQEQYGMIAEQVREAGVPPESALEIGRNLLFGETTNQENQQLVQEWSDRWETYPGEAFYREMHSWLDRPDFTDELASIDIPVLIVHGEEDIALEPDRAERMLDHLPDARMELIPDAGHSSNLENPSAVNRAVREFLDDIY